MKDKFIERKLKNYVEAVKPKNKVLDAAIFALRQKRQVKNTTAAPVYSGRKRGLIIGLSVAASVLLVIGLIIVIRQINYSSMPQTYALADLTYHTETIEEIENNTNILTIGITNAYINGRIYSNEKNEPVAISILYKTLGEGGLDEIVVIADLKGGLSDYKNFTKYSTTTIGSVAVNFKEIPENGEFYTEAYFQNAGVDYYVKITSPIESGEYYIGLLLKT